MKIIKEKDLRKVAKQNAKALGISEKESYELAEKVALKKGYWIDHGTKLVGGKSNKMTVKSPRITRKIPKLR